MDNVNTIIKHAEQYCKTHGARLTPKRKKVLSSMLQSTKALSAYDIIDFCKREFNETIPAMSMYRILEFLENEHLIHKLKLANKYVACAHITCNHDHAIPQFLICGQCDKVREISINKSTIRKLRENVETAGFELVSPQIEMNCICLSCKHSVA